MKTMLTSRKCHCLTGSTILLVTVALIAGIAGCGTPPAPDPGPDPDPDPSPTPPLYSLTISSTDGGLVTTAGEGTFNYDEGTVVILTARADTGHRFVNWSGDVGPSPM